LITVQTNNATFDGAEAAQQLGMVRLRAVEHGREALMASTVGISGFVDAHGTVHGATAFDTQAVVLRQLRLGTGRTLATRLGSIPEAVLVAVAVAALIGAAILRRRIRVAAAGASGAASASERAVTGPAELTGPAEAGEPAAPGEPAEPAVAGEPAPVADAPTSGRAPDGPTDEKESS
jgi:hypothetical protein